MADFFPLLITNQKIWLGLNSLPSIPRTRQRVNSGKFCTWMYLPYCVPIHWGRGGLEMLALDIHFIQGYFGNPVSSTSCPGLVCFALLCFVLFCFWHLPDSCWAGQVPCGAQGRCHSQAWPPFHLAQHLSLCSVSSKPKMILISTDMYSLQLKSDLYWFDFDYSSLLSFQDTCWKKL